MAMIRNMTAWLWLASAGAIVQIMSLGADFYVHGGERKNAWFGIPQTSDLILISALVALGLVGATLAGRGPLPSRRLGLAIGAAGLIATLQLAYRMAAPPFGGAVPDHVGIVGISCLYYCLPSQAEPAELLPGIWLALAGCIAVTLGGFLHALSSAARQAPFTPPIASAQTGMTPWLALAGLGAVGQFVFGFTFFTFFATVGESGPKTWSGWLPMPHTGMFVLVVTLVVVGLVWLAGRRRSPLSPSSLGALIAVLGFLSAARIGFRIVQSPFGSSAVEIGLAAYLSALAAVLLAVSGAAHTFAQRGAQPPSVES